MSNGYITFKQCKERVFEFTFNKLRQRHYLTII